MKMQRFSLFIFISLFLLGCSSTHHYSYRIDQPFGDKAEGYIAGLPVMFEGVTPSSECVAEVEKNIEEELTDLLDDKYIPISEGRKEYAPLISALTNHHSADSQKALNVNLESILKTQKELCTDMSDTSRCRYAVLPRSVISGATARMTLSIGYAIPLGPIIIYGSLPVPLSVENEFLPVYTLSLIDLQNKSIIAEEVIALKEDVEDACDEYPDNYLRNIAFKQNWK